MDELGYPGDEERRAGDSPEVDPRALRREPVQVTLSRDALTDALRSNLRRAATVGALAGIIAAVLIAAITGFYVKKVVTDTVRSDIGNATILNCDHARTTARALRRFLSTDAAYSAQLARLDVETRRIDHDLAVRVGALGQVIPTAIASDYQDLSDVFQQLAARRTAIADLWAGKKVRGGGRAPSLASSVVVATRPRCDKILSG